MGVQCDGLVEWDGRQGWSHVNVGSSCHPSYQWLLAIDVKMWLGTLMYTRYM